MDLYSSAELLSIKRELDSIIDELESISMGIRNNFTGIGNEKCAASIDKIISHYYDFRCQLNNIDERYIDKAKAGPFGGGKGGGTRE